MNCLEQKSGMSNQATLFGRAIATTFLIAIFLFGGAASSRAQQQPTRPQAQESVQSVVAKQAALVSEFDVNGLKVLLKRREGSLTVAAGLFIRGGAANINLGSRSVDRSDGVHFASGIGQIAAGRISHRQQRACAPGRARFRNQCDGRQTGDLAVGNERITMSVGKDCERHLPDRAVGHDVRFYR